MFEQLKQSITEATDYQNDPFVKAVSDKLLSTLEQHEDGVSVERLLEVFRGYLQALLSPANQTSGEQAGEILGSDFYRSVDVRKMLSLPDEEVAPPEQPLLPYSIPTLYRAKGNYLLIEGIPISVKALCKRHPDLFDAGDPPWFKHEKFAKTKVASRAFLIHTKIGMVLKEGVEIDPKKQNSPPSYPKSLRAAQQSEVALAHVVSSLRNGTSAFGKELMQMPSIRGFPAYGFVYDGKLNLTYNHDP